MADMNPTAPVPRRVGAAAALQSLRIATPPVPIAPSPQATERTTVDLKEDLSPKRKRNHFYCFRCGCRGKISKYATAQGRGRVVPSHCACAQCSGDARCVFSSIDQCYICGDHYELDEKEHCYLCPSRCSDPAVSTYARRFLSLSAVDINTPLPPWKRTLLHSAVAAGDASLCWNLLKRGANPFACDHLGVSPVALATSMLPEEDEANCIADHSYKSAIEIYHMLPKINSAAFEYIEHLCPTRKMVRCFSMGDYHGPGAGFGGFSPPRSGAGGPLSCPSVASGFRGRGGSVGSFDSSPTRSPKGVEKKPKPSRARSSSLHEGSTKRSGHRRRRRRSVGKTWADVVSRARKDPVQAFRSPPSTILHLPSHKDMASYDAAMRQWTAVVRGEGKTHALLDSGLQTFTPLTLSRLMDTSIDTYTLAASSNEYEDVPAGSSIASGGLSGDMFAIEEDGAGVQGGPVTPGSSPRRGRGFSRDFSLGSPRRERSYSQSSIGSPTCRLRTRTHSITEPTAVRRRTYSEAEQGGSRALLRHCTLHELKGAVLDNDAVHASCEDPFPSMASEIDDDGDELLLSCTACMDCLRPSEFAYSCHRMGCGGNLCQDCLYRSLVVSVSSALYAVPMVRCPGKCHGRVPTNAWRFELGGIVPTPQEVDSLVVTTAETAGSLLEGMRLAMNRCLEMELEVYHNPESEDIAQHREIMQRAADEFFLKSRRLMGMQGATFEDVFTRTVEGESAVSTAGVGKISVFSLVTFGEALSLHPAREELGFGRLFGLSKYSMHDTLQDLMSRVSAEEIVAGGASNCVDGVRAVVVAFVVHMHVSHPALLGSAEQAFQEDDQKQSSVELPTASELLLGRYKHNAESLLMMRCGKCDKSVSLLYSKRLPAGMAARQEALTVLLLPLKDEDQIALLRAFVAFSGASIAPSTFISSLFCVWAKLQPIAVVESCDAGVLHSDLAMFMESVIVLLEDIERRLAAQLALCRAYPKVFSACCDSAHCFMCKVKGHHPGKSCEEVQSALVGEEAQYCPGCGVPTLRTEGCHQILCVCGMSWQWKGGEDPNDVNYNFNDGGSDSFDDDSDSDDSFDDSESSSADSEDM